MHDVAASSPAEGSLLNDVFLNPSLGARRINVPGDTVLYEPDHAAGNVYFIHRGQVRIYQVGPDNTARLLDILGPNEWFGAEALASLPAYGSRAVTMVMSVISEIPADSLLSLLSQQPTAVLELTRQLAVRLQAAREDAARLVFDDCNQRLIKTLLRFSRSAAATPQGDSVVLRITHQQLAQAVGVARETISLALTQLRHRNLLRTGRNELIFKPELLRQFEQRSLARSRQPSNVQVL